MKSKNVLLKGAMIIALSGFLSKLIGAFYRIPLTNILGSDGIGIYQLVFPLYSLLLTISSTGIPQSLSKLVSERISLNQPEKARGILKSSLLMFGGIGIIGSILMALFASVLSRLQGEPLARYAYLFISPSVFLVSVISCLRGYFQGKMNMTPTGASQIIEQIVKLSFGLFFAVLFRNNIVKAAAFACFSVTISEFVALIFMIVLLKFNFRKNRVKTQTEHNVYKTIMKITLPVTMSAILIPVSQLIDSFLIINILEKYMQSATGLYGLYTGGVMTIIGLPVCICYGVAAAVLPLISRHYALKQFDLVQNKIMLAIKYTLFICIPAFIFCMYFSKNTVQLLFSGMQKSEISTMSKILVYASPSIFFLSLVQTLSACLIAKNKQIVPAISMFAGIVVKIVLEIILLNNQKISINGAAISAVICYFVATVINLVYIIKDKKNYLKFGRLTAVFFIFTIPALLSSDFVFKTVKGTIGFLSAGVIFLAIYLLLVFIFKIFKGDELVILKRKEKK